MINEMKHKITATRLTFDHDHVDIDGADLRLREAFPFL